MAAIKKSQTDDTGCHRKKNSKLINKRDSIEKESVQNSHFEGGEEKYNK